MSADLQKLQEAIHARLSADSGLGSLLGGPKMYDRPPEGAAMPYITYGATRTFNAGTASEEAREHLFHLHVWSKTGGRKQCMDVMEAAETALQTLPAISGAIRIVSLRQQGEEIGYEPDLRAWHGILRLRAVTEA
ncbi:MAG: DUF3168 domain-containing protein, partial [Rhizobiaceae bacterium]